MQGGGLRGNGRQMLLFTATSWDAPMSLGTWLTVPVMGDGHCTSSYA